MNPNTRGQGRIFKPGNTRFWWCGYYRAGQEIRESTGVEYLEPDPSAKAKKAAFRYLRARVDAVRAERGGGPDMVTPTSRKVTVNELLTGLEADYKARHKWNPKVASNVKPLRSHFGPIRAVDLSKAAITAYMVKMQAEGYRDSSINRRVQLLLQSFTVAERQAPKVKRLSEIGNERKGFFERADFLQMVEHLPGYLKDYARLAYITGWRRGALSNLAWSDVDDSKIYLRAEHSKNRKPVTVPLTGEIAEIIARRKLAQVVKSKTGEITFSRYVFHRNAKQIGDFRKVWATACLRAGCGGGSFTICAGQRRGI